MKMIKTTAAAMCLVLVTACNTIEGIGKDVQIAGNAITTSAEVASGD